MIKKNIIWLCIFAGICIIIIKCLYLSFQISNSIQATIVSGLWSAAAATVLGIIALVQNKKLHEINRHLDEENKVIQNTVLIVRRKEAYTSSNALQLTKRDINFANETPIGDLKKNTLHLNFTFLFQNALPEEYNVRSIIFKLSNQILISLYKLDHWTQVTINEMNTFTIFLKLYIDEEIVKQITFDKQEYNIEIDCDFKRKLYNSTKKSKNSIVSEYKIFEKIEADGQYCFRITDIMIIKNNVKFINEV